MTRELVSTEEGIKVENYSFPFCLGDFQPLKIIPTLVSAPLCLSKEKNFLVEVGFLERNCVYL